MGYAEDARIEEFTSIISHIEEDYLLTEDEVKINNIAQYEQVLGDDNFDYSSIKKNISKLDTLILIDRNIKDIANLELSEFKSLKKIVYKYEEIIYDDYLEIEETIKGNNIIERESKTIKYNFEVEVKKLKRVYPFNIEKDLTCKLRVLEELDIYTQIKLSKKDASMIIKNYPSNSLGTINEMLDLINKEIDFLEIDFLFEKIEVIDSKIADAEIFDIKDKIDLKEITINKSMINYNIILEKSSDIIFLALVNMNLTSIKQIPKLSNLQTLDLSFNNLVNVESLEIKFPELENLILSHNKLTKIPQKFPENITDIYIDNNIIEGTIRNIPKDTEFLNLSHNKIKKIILKEQEYSNEVLELSHNEIEEFKNIDNFKSSNLIRLDYNPIINNEKKVIDLNKKNKISILPRIIYKSKKDIIGYFGIVKKKIEKSEIEELSFQISNDLKYSKSIMGNNSESMKGGIDNNYCGLIKGDWGSGKTYFYKNVLKEKLKNTGFEPIEYSTTLNNKENSFYTILSSLKKERKLCNFLKKLYESKRILILLFFVTLFLGVCIDYVNQYIIYSNIVIPFELLTSIMNNLKIGFIIPVLSLPVTLKEKNQILSGQEKELKKISKLKKIIVIDDLERIKIEKQVEVLNTIQTFKNYIPIILLTDEKELKKMLTTYYGKEFDYQNYKNKLFDYEYDYNTLSPTNYEYYKTNVNIEDVKEKEYLGEIVKNSYIFNSMSIRRFNQSLINIFHKRNTNYISGLGNTPLLYLIGKELKKNEAEEKIINLKKEYQVIKTLEELKVSNHIKRKLKEILSEFPLDFYLIIYSENKNKKIEEKINSIIKKEKYRNIFNDTIEIEQREYIKKEDVEIVLKKIKEYGIYIELLETIELSHISTQNPYLEKNEMVLVNKILEICNK